jgi:hypothetical protein
MFLTPKLLQDSLGCCKDNMVELKIKIKIIDRIFHREEHTYTMYNCINLKTKKNKHAKEHKCYDAYL